MHEVEKSYVRTDVAARTSNWSRDDKYVKSLKIFLS